MSYHMKDTCEIQKRKKKTNYETKLNEIKQFTVKASTQSKAIS